MVVYGDLLFMINFSMDFLCFYFSCLLTHRKLPNFRAILASSLGGVYSVAVLFIKCSQPYAFLLDLAVLFLMCVIVYASKKMTAGSLLKGVFIYFLVSALLGGVMTSLYSLLNRFDSVLEDFAGEDDIGMWAFLLLAVVGSILSVNGGKIFRSGASQRRVMLEIENGGKIANISALVDSGNLLTEPISGKNVVIVRLKALEKILDEEVYSALAVGDVCSLPLSVMSKIRLIPARAVSGEALLPAQKFDRVILKSQKNTKELDVYIAFAKENSFGECDAIISHETII